MRNLFFAFLLSLSIGHAVAAVDTKRYASAHEDAAAVKGRVLDAQGQPLAGAVVALVGHGAQVTTRDGSFAFRGVRTGTYTLRITAQGHAPLERENVQVTDAGLDIADIQLDYKEQTLSEVEILDYANRYQNLGRLPEVSTTGIYAAKKTEVVYLDPGTTNLAVNNPRQTFAKIPGIVIWETDAQNQGLNIAARGLSPNRSWEFNVRQDGVDISADPVSYSEAYYNPPLELVERIEVVRGAGSLQYGPQMGGSVNYVMKRSLGLKPFEVEARITGGSYGLLSGFAQVGGKQGKWNYSAAFVRRQSDGWRQNSQYWLNQGFAVIGYQPTNNLNIRAEYSVANTRFQQPGNLPDDLFAEDPRQSLRSRNWFGLDWHLPSVHLDWEIADSLHLNVRVFGQIAQRPATTSRVGNNRLADDFGVRNLTLDEYANYGTEARLRGFYGLFGSKHAYVVGVRYFDGQLNRRTGGVDAGTGTVSDYPAGAVFATDFVVDSRNASAFVENAFTFGDLITTIGLRYEYIESDGSGRNGTATRTFPTSTVVRNRVLLGVGAEYHVTKGTELYTNYTQSYRPVVFGNFVPSLNANGAFNQVDPDLEDASGYNVDLGYRGRIGDWLHFDVSAFYLWYNNRPANVPLAQADAPDPAAWVNGIQLLTNGGASRSHGIESFVEINPLKALGIASRIGDFSIFNSTGYTDASYGANRNPNITGRRLEFSPFWVVRSGLQWQLEPVRLSITHSYVDRSFSNNANTTNPDVNGNAGVVPAYRVWDVTASVQINQYLEVTAGASNLFDSRYATRRNSGLVVAEPRIVTLGVGAKF